MNEKRRVWEIDVMRGIAIVLMVVFHFIVDLSDFYNYDIAYLSGFWYYVGKTSAITFIFVSGISSTFSRNNIKRGFKILCWGLVITAVTFIYSRYVFIQFGILHFLGVSMMLTHFLSKLHKKYLLLLAAIILVIGNYFSNIYVNTPYLFPIGLIIRQFRSLDYYPLMPWLSVYILGIVIGKRFYTQPKSLFSFTPSRILDVFVWLSRHSLKIYLLHQPILLAILFLYHYF